MHNSNYLASGNAEYDLKDWWNQMDALTEHIQAVGMSPKIQGHQDCVTPKTDFYPHSPMVNKEKLHRMYPECFSGIGKLKIMNTTLN